jgi:hypothetical protein
LVVEGKRWAERERVAVVVVSVIEMGRVRKGSLLVLLLEGLVGTEGVVSADMYFLPREEDQRRLGR